MASASISNSQGLCSPEYKKQLLLPLGHAYPLPTPPSHLKPDCNNPAEERIEGSAAGKQGVPNIMTTKTLGSEASAVSWLTAAAVCWHKLLKGLQGLMAVWNNLSLKAPSHPRKKLQSAPATHSPDYPLTLSFRRALTAPCITTLSHEIESSFRSLAVIPSVTALAKPRVVTLPPTLKKTLVLDLDETLVYAVRGSVTEIPGEANLADLRVVRVRTEEGQHVEVTFLLRPDAQVFLKEMAQIYDVVIFTAATRSYAQKVVNCLDPNGLFVSAILSRENCVLQGGQYIKDLRVLGGRDLKEVIIVDNNIVSFAGCLENGIYVPSFECDHHDVGLARIMPFLKHAATFTDVRPAVRSFAGIAALYEKYKHTKPHCHSSPPSSYTGRVTTRNKRGERIQLEGVLE